MSRATLGKAAYVSESLVAAWETARYVPKPDQIADLERVLGTNGVLGRMADDLVKNEAFPEYIGKWFMIESEARQLLTFEPTLIPGLLQSEDYGREVLFRSGRIITDLEERVAARISRQKVLAAENDMTFVAVIDEVVLYRPVVSAEVMVDQLTHLLEVAGQPNAHILVVPRSVGAHPGCAGGFAIASLDGREVVYTDNAFSGDILEINEDVVTMKRVWEFIRAEALSGGQSIELIVKAMETWK